MYAVIVTVYSKMEFNFNSREVTKDTTNFGLQLYSALCMYVCFMYLLG